MLDVEYTNTEMFNLIDEWIHSTRDRRLMKDRMINGVCIETLAEKYEVSSAQAKRIIEKNKEILLRHLKVT